MCACAQSCPTLSDPTYYSPPGFSVHGIFQARILEGVAISFCRASSWPRDGTQVSCISCLGRRNLYSCATWEALISLNSLFFFFFKVRGRGKDSNTTILELLNTVRCYQKTLLRSPTQPPHFTQEEMGSERHRDVPHVIQPFSEESIQLYLDDLLQRCLCIKCEQKRITLQPSPFRSVCVAPRKSSPRVLEKQRDIIRSHLPSWL